MQKQHQPLWRKVTNWCKYECTQERVHNDQHPSIRNRLLVRLHHCAFSHQLLKHDHKKNKELKEWFTKAAIFFMVWKLRGGKGRVEVSTRVQWAHKDKDSDGAELKMRNSVLSRETALDMFFWFPVTGQFQFGYEFVCTVVLHTPTNVQQSVWAENVTDEDLLLGHEPISGSGPDTLLVSLWSRNKPYIRPHEGGPDLTPAWFSVVCMCSEPTDFI